MPKKFSRQLRDRAFRLYLDDTYSAREIAEQVSQEFREVVKEAEGKTIQYLLTQFLRSEIERVKRNKVVLNG